MTEPIYSPSHFDLNAHAWLNAPSLRRIAKTIADAGGEARVVGGAIRDALLAQETDRDQPNTIEVGDVDLATTLRPEAVMTALIRSGIKVIPTGLQHGTVTAVIEHVGYEITTLRHDLETDGRHAKVAFIDDWQVDAARRDFTINALFADMGGKIYDYQNGLSDLRTGRIRFIGVPEERIREDVLRILRFFRFYAWFGKGDCDQEAVNACEKFAHLIEDLSAERVWRELTKLLTAENPLSALRVMKLTGTLASVLPEATDFERFECLLKLETTHAMPPKPLLRLIALIPEKSETIARLAKRLKLSNREVEYLEVVGMLAPQLRGKLDPVPFRRALYEHGPDAGRDAAMLVATEDESVSLEPILEIALNWECPTFPLQGSDILKLGIKPGPRLGEILNTAKEWWIASDFHGTHAECLQQACARADLLLANDNKK